MQITRQHAFTSKIISIIFIKPALLSQQSYFLQFIWTGSFNPDYDNSSQHRSKLILVYSVKINEGPRIRGWLQICGIESLLINGVELPGVRANYRV